VHQAFDAASGDVVLLARPAPALTSVKITSTAVAFSKSWWQSLTPVPTGESLVAKEWALTMDVGSTLLAGWLGCDGLQRVGGDGQRGVGSPYHFFFDSWAGRWRGWPHVRGHDGGLSTL